MQSGLLERATGHAESTKKDSSHSFSPSQLDPFRSLVIYPSTLAKSYRKETGKETKTYEERVKLPELFESKNQRLWVELIVPARHWGPSEQSPEAAGGDRQEPSAALTPTLNIRSHPWKSRKLLFLRTEGEGRHLFGVGLGKKKKE